MVKRSLMTLLALLVLMGMAYAERPAELKAEVVVNSDHGWPTKIVISGFNPKKIAYLGMSLYPYGVVDPVTGGRHSFIELKQGEFRQEIAVDMQLLGGSFELGLWGKRVDKVDCTEDFCYWCKINGFHVEESLAYKSGLLTRMSGYGS